MVEENGRREVRDGRREEGRDIEKGRLMAEGKGAMDGREL